MADPQVIRRYIDKALRNNEIVVIRYQDFHKNVTERRITPLEWVGVDKIRAFCHLRDEERHFRLQNILAVNAAHDDVGKSPPVKPKPPLTPPQAAQVTTIKAPTKKPTQTQNPKQTFSEVSSTEEWKSLLRYYVACLNYEYQQQFSFKQNALYPYDFNQDTIYAFLSGKSHLSFVLE